MGSPEGAALPDFNRLAAVFDRYLFLIEPVGEAVLARLPALGDGARAIDVACGTGEPGLTLARRAPQLELIGVDAAAGMIDVARQKAARDGLANISFEVMNAEALTFADGSVDAVLSRFGMLMFGDRIASAKELARVLRPGGAFSVAVWDDMANNTLVRTMVGVLRPHVPAELVAPFDAMDGAIAVEDLRRVGLAEVETRPFAWDYAFTSEEALRQFLTGPGLFSRHFEAMDAADRERVSSAALAPFAAYRQPAGDYRIPHECRLFWGKR